VTKIIVCLFISRNKKEDVNLKIMEIFLHNFAFRMILKVTVFPLLLL